MSKKHIRSGMIGFCVFTLAVIAGIGTSRIMKSNREEAVVERSVSAEESVGAVKVSDECYIARLDGEVLAVYVYSGDKEEFMYTLDVRVEDISEREKMRLKEGVILESRQELASFEEDFTS